MYIFFYFTTYKSHSQLAHHDNLLPRRLFNFICVSCSYIISKMGGGLSVFCLFFLFFFFLQKLFASEDFLFMIKQPCSVGILYINILVPDLPCSSSSHIIFPFNSKGRSLHMSSTPKPTDKHKLTEGSLRKRF